MRLGTEKDLVFMHLITGDVEDRYTTSIRKGGLAADDLERHLQQPRKNKKYLLDEMRTLVNAWSIDMLPGENVYALLEAKDMLIDDLAKKDFAGLRKLLSLYETLRGGKNDYLQLAYSHDDDTITLSVTGNFSGDSVAVAEVEVGTKPGEVGGDTAETPEVADASSAGVEAEETTPFAGSFRALARTAASEYDTERVLVAASDGTRILSVEDFQKFRPDLFKSERRIASTLVRGADGEALIQTDYSPQKKFFLETNGKGNLDHQYVQKEFELFESAKKSLGGGTDKNTLEKLDAIRLGRQQLIKKGLYALAAEKPPANAAMFDALTDKLSASVEGRDGLAERMFSEKKWGDERMRVVYSEDKGVLEVQQRSRIKSPARAGGRARWIWETVLAEKVVGKK